jgi:hypothetical protein
MKCLYLFILVLVAACQTKIKSPNKTDAAQTITNVTIEWDSLKYLLQSCSATLENNDLKLYIDRRSDSLSSDYAIEILRINKKFNVAMDQPWSLTDSSYVSPRFKILDQKIKLDKEVYQIGDLLQGELFLVVKAHDSYVRDVGEMLLRNNWDTIMVVGTFSSIVK